MEKSLTALEAKYEAQKIAFGPIYFQSIIALRELGILQYIAKHRKGIAVKDIAPDLRLTKYGVEVLIEAAEAMDVLEYTDDNKIKISKIGYFLNQDEMTQINLDFVNDVCYEGAKSLTDCIKNEKPEGLKFLGNWDTIYEGLSILPEPAKKSWFDFDHYYSDDAFPYALEIVCKENPKYIFDIGGNTGKWAFACCNYNPKIKVKILDLPVQLNVAKKNAAEKNLTDRIDFHQIDLLDTFQKIPQGADVIWMSQFLDCFSEEEILQILKNVAQASNENTTTYIMEPFIDNQKFEAAKYSLVATSLYFTLMANGNSKMYSINVMKDIVDKAGLKVIEEFSLIGNSYHTILKCKRK